MIDSKNREESEYKILIVKKLIITIGLIDY